jgi:hypothetical protein
MGLLNISSNKQRQGASPAPATRLSSLSFPREVEGRNLFSPSSSSDFRTHNLYSNVTSEDVSVLFSRPVLRSGLVARALADVQVSVTFRVWFHSRLNHSLCERLPYNHRP